MVLRTRGRRRDDGAVLVFIAPCLVVLFAMTALVVDLGNARQESRQAQASADAAALAGASKLPVAGPDSAAAAAAEVEAAQYVNLNLTGSAATPTAATCPSGVPAGSTCYTVGSASVVAASPYVGTWTGAPRSYSLVYVKICQPTASFFAGAIGASSPTVCREAVGRRKNSSGGLGLGLVVIDPTACGALTFQGTSTTTLSSNGAVMVNSNCTNTTQGAMDSSGSAWNLEATFIGVVGNPTLSPCDPTITNACTSTVPQPVDPFDDPLSLSPPSPIPPTSPTSACPAGGVNVMQPGTYPTACTFNNGAFIFRPGVYYLQQGFKSAGSASMVCSDTATTFPLPAANTCAGVTFIIAGAHFDMTGSGKVYLPPPTTGPYAGVTFYQTSSSSSTINGTSDFLLGTVYAPNALLNFTGSGGSGGIKVNIEGMVVAKKADISGSFRFNINVPEDQTVDAPVDDIGLDD